MQQWITMTADDATMNVIIKDLNSHFSFLKPLLDFKFIYILKIIQHMKV